MMTKKILFLLAFLLTTIGGGNFALAADETFTLSTVTSGTSYDQTQNGVRLVIDKGSSGSSFHNGGNGYRLYPSGATITITAPEGYAVTELVLTSNKKGNDVDKMTGFTITGNSDWNPFSGKLDSYTWTNSSNTTNPITFTTKNSDNGDVYIASIKVTYSKVPYSGTMPYTWIFNYVGSQWPNTTASMLTSTTTYWEAGSVGEQSGYVTKKALSNEALVDGNKTEISETTGLKFTAAAGNIGTALQYELGLKGNASVTIPAKAGQKIAVHAWWPAETMTLTNATVDNTSNETTFTPSPAGAYTYNFTATADNVTLRVNSNMVFIYYIAVTKTDINFGSLGGNKTTDVFGATDWNYAFTFRDPKNAATVMSMNSAEWSNVTFSLPNTNVITFTKNGLDAGNNRGSITIHPVAAGSVEMNVSFPGSDRYNAKEGTITFTINKQTPTVTFDKGTDQKMLAHSTGTYTNAATASNGKTVTYTSSNPNVATVSDGVVTFVNSGVTTITASVEGDENYNAASANYTLTVNGSTNPTLTWTYDSNFPNLSGTTHAYGSIAYCFATATGTTETVKYKSSNTKIATVDVEAHGGQANACKITSTGNGEVTITAYVEGKGDVNPAEVSFTMTIEGQEVHMSFQPTSGTVKVGNTITPYISVPDIKMADITSVTVETSDASMATVTAGETTETSNTYTLTKANGGLTSYTKGGTEYLEHIYATIKGEAVTSGAVTITVTVNSDIYKPTKATYQVTVNDEDLNFNWEAPSQTYTLYTGDYMMIPAITGNANGNWSYSKGSTCESEHAYLYDIKSGTPTWNNRDFKIGEGIPDYRLYESDGTTVTDKAYIVWVNGQSGHTDVLMIYAKSAGTVKLHAKDPQTGASPVDITINIINKSTLTSATTSYVNNMSFPYTWSFVGESSIAAVSPNYWEEHEDYYTCGMSTAFNFDYCDEDDDGDTGEALKGKYFVDENGIMPQFYGMTVEFGNSGDKNHPYKAKEDRLRLYKYDSNNPDQPLLQVVGGTHKIALPAPGAGCPSNYKLFVKARSRKNPAKDAILQAYWSDSKKPYYSFTNNEPIIFSVDVTSGDPVKELWVSDVDIYWIAMSTEEKKVNRPLDENPNLSYAASTYAYSKALDLSKSEEANEGLEVYYASGFNTGSNATVGSAVVLTRMTTDNKPVVEANTGLVLKSAEATTNYMIAHALNAASPSVPEVFTGSGTATNYLVAGPGTIVYPTTGTGENTKTNFIMSRKYKMYNEEETEAVSDYRYDRDWSFYKILPSATVPTSNAYLSIRGNLYVDKYGNIVEASSARAAFDVESAADDDTAEAPASKLMLDIIFQETSNTATEDPATEEPEDEDGNSDKDKDRPRKPGDDGWPKPPFPPFPPIITDIDSVNTETTDNAVWHSMEGVRISQPTKPGLYIRNGKKIVIK